MRRVSTFLRRHLPMLLTVLVLLAVVVVLWIFSAPIASWIRSAQSFDAIAFLGDHLFTVAMLGGCLLVLALIWLPKWQAASVQDVKDRLTVENAARQTLAQIVGGAVLIAGLFFTWANLKITQETATKNQEITREGQITDRFTKAIAHLGDQGPEKLAIRLGGIYALERIAKDWKDDHWPIMEVLTAYIRETASWPPNQPKDVQLAKSDQSFQEKLPTTSDQQPPRPAADIQAILTVLGRRTQTYGNGEQQQLNLANTDLRGAILQGAQLQEANLRGAQLQEANLQDAQLQGASLRGAQLQGAILRGAQLQEVDFWGAQLREAFLGGAQLQGANLHSAQLQGANLGGAQLQEAFLWGAQLQGANLGGAQLQGASLWGVQLWGGSLQDAQLQGASLQDAQLQGADFWGTQLEGARNLTVEQLSTVKTLYQAHLDASLLEQIQQQYPQLLEMPEDVKKSQK